MRPTQGVSRGQALLPHCTAGRAYHEDDRVRAGVDVHHRRIQGHQLVLRRVPTAMSAGGATMQACRHVARTFPSVGRASAAATFFLARCSRDSSAVGGTTAAVFLLALATQDGHQVSEQATHTKCKPLHSACAPVNDLPHLDADDVVGRGRTGPRNLGGRNLRAADARTQGVSPWCACPTCRHAWRGVHPASRALAHTTARTRHHAGASGGTTCRCPGRL